MFDDLHIRTITKGEDTYIHALDFAQHLIYVAMDLQNTLPPTDDKDVKMMDYAAFATLRMVAQLILRGEDVEYMRNNLETYEDFLALADIDNPEDL